VAGLGLLFQASMLFAGLIVLFPLQAMISGARFRLADALAVFALGMLFFVSFSLFLQGTVRGTRNRR